MLCLFASGYAQGMYDSHIFTNQSLGSFEMILPLKASFAFGVSRQPLREMVH